MLYSKPIPPHFTSDDYKSLRRHVSFSQQEMANWLGVSRSTIARREDGSLPITREAELAARFFLVSETGEYHFAWKNSSEKGKELPE